MDEDDESIGLEKGVLTQKMLATHLPTGKDGIEAVGVEAEEDCATNVNGEPEAMENELGKKKAFVDCGMKPSSDLL
jgi:hypothetical protein